MNNIDIRSASDTALQLESLGVVTLGDFWGLGAEELPEQQEKGISRVISMKLSDLGVKAKK